MVNKNDGMIQSFTMDDGRRAERVTSVNEDGHEVVETFVEEKRPLKLEKRIIRERKEVLAKETHETVRDGEVITREVLSMEADIPLQIREKIAVADHAKIVDGDYVRRDEIGKIVADGVVEGVQALMENMSMQSARPIFGAQAAIEENIETKKKKDIWFNAVLYVILAAQVVFFGYTCFVI